MSWTPPEPPPGPAPQQWGAPPPPPPPQPQQPWGPPPQPWGTPPPKRSKAPLVLGILGAVVVLLVLASFVVGTTSDDEDGDSSSGTGSGVEAIETPDPGGDTVTAGDVSITLPEGWVGADLTSGTDGIGAELFPDDADSAASMDTVLSMLPRVIVLAGFDEEGVRDRDLFVSNLNVLPDESIPAGMDLEEVVAIEARGVGSLGGEATHEVVELGGRPVGRIEADIAQGPTEYSVVGYVIQEGGVTYVVTFSFADPSVADVALADASAATFSVG